jgi:hypothetical protein
VQRQAKATADAEAKRKAAEERLAAILKFEQGRAESEAATKKPDIKVPPPTRPQPLPPVAETNVAVPLPAERERALKPKDVFKECPTCPEMVVVPAGSTKGQA